MCQITIPFQSSILCFYSFKKWVNCHEKDKNSNGRSSCDHVEEEIFMFLHVVDLVGDGCNGMVVW